MFFFSVIILTSYKFENYKKALFKAFHERIIYWLFHRAKCFGNRLNVVKHKRSDATF